MLLFRSTFTLILSLSDPKLLASPFGVLTKNIPLMVALWTAWKIEREGWSERTEWILRLGMAFIWFTEGLIPKILFQQREEIDIAIASGCSLGHPDILLRVIGSLQILSGILALSLKKLRWLVLVLQAAGLLILPLWVGMIRPDLWAHPFGPFTKNIPILMGTLVLIRRCRSSS